MMSLILFIFLVFVCLLLWPVIKVWWVFRKARKHAQEFFGSQSPYGGHSSHDGAAGSRPRHRRRRGKIIDSSVGEYVEFEEIQTVSESSDASGYHNSIKYETEEQVVDVKWEDIK